MPPFMAIFSPFMDIAQEYSTAQKSGHISLRNPEWKTSFLCTVRVSTHINLHSAGKQEYTDQINSRPFRYISEASSEPS